MYLIFETKSMIRNGNSWMQSEGPSYAVKLDKTDSNSINAVAWRVIARLERHDLGMHVHVDRQRVLSDKEFDERRFVLVDSFGRQLAEV